MTAMQIKLSKKLEQLLAQSFAESRHDAPERLCPDRFFLRVLRDEECHATYIYANY